MNLHFSFNENLLSRPPFQRFTEVVEIPIYDVLVKLHCRNIPKYYKKLFCSKFQFKDILQNAVQPYSVDKGVKRPYVKGI